MGQLLLPPAPLHAHACTHAPPGTVLERCPRKLGRTDKKVWPLFSGQGMESTSRSWAASVPNHQTNSRRPWSWPPCTRPPCRGPGSTRAPRLWTSSPEPLLKCCSHQPDCKQILEHTKSSAACGHSEALRGHEMTPAVLGHGWRGPILFFFLTNRGSPHTSLGDIATEHQLTLDTAPSFHTVLTGRETI